MNPSVLIVEDDPSIRNLISTTLKAHDIRHKGVSTGQKALLEASTYKPDIVFLDLGLPDMDGVDVIRSIRNWSEMPIIVISARTDDQDKIEALDAGADDYLTKPFSIDELLARLRVVNRRLSSLKREQPEMVFENGNLKIDYDAGCVYVAGKEIHLTPYEYKLICLLSRNIGKVLTHTYITNHVWGSSWDNDVASLRVFMANLRRKLERIEGGQPYIQTHVGIGYRMVRVDD